MFQIINRIAGICSGQNHVVALGKEGHIYQWGDREDRLSLVPEILLGSLEHKKVVDIACGEWHSLCLTSEGQVYSWGNLSYGSWIGRHCKEQYQEPELVPFPGYEIRVKIMAVDCGTVHSYALDLNGNVSYLRRFIFKNFIV